MYYKLLRADMNHHGFQYKEGLNVLDSPFCPDEHKSNGLYFSEGNDVWNWIELYDDLYWIADVTFSDETDLARFEYTLKAERIFLHNIRPIAEFLRDPTEQIKAVAKIGSVIRFMDPQPPELCLAAVNQAGSYLQYVLHQTPELCTAAVEQSPYAIYYVKEQTPELCMTAVTRNGMALQHIRNPTQEVCAAAVRQTQRALKFVPAY